MLSVRVRVPKDGSGALKCPPLAANGACALEAWGPADAVHARAAGPGAPPHRACRLPPAPIRNRLQAIERLSQLLGLNEEPPAPPASSSAAADDSREAGQLRPPYTNSRAFG